MSLWASSQHGIPQQQAFRRGPRMMPLLLGMGWSKAPTADSSWTCTIERKRQIPIQALFGHVLVYSAPHFVLPWRVSLSMAQIHERGQRCWWWNRNKAAVSWFVRKEQILDSLGRLFLLIEHPNTCLHINAPFASSDFQNCLQIVVSWFLLVVLLCPLPFNGPSPSDPADLPSLPAITHPSIGSNTQQPWDPLNQMKLYPTFFSGASPFKSPNRLVFQRELKMSSDNGTVISVCT